MNSTEILEALQFIADDSSKINKSKYLKNFLEDAEFRRVICLAYDPFVTFGIKETAKPFALGVPLDFTEQTFSLFHDLSTRTLSGNAAKDAVFNHIIYLNVPSQVLFQMILNKNLGAGFDVKSINKAMPGLVPHFAYMRCSLPKEVKLETWDWAGGIFSQEKMDGLFINVTTTKGAVSFHTRKGQEFPKEELFELSEDFISLGFHGHQYHGEMLVRRDGKLLSRKEGNGILNSILKGGKFKEGDEAVIVVWDCIKLSTLTGDVDEPYSTRFIKCRSALRQSDLISAVKYKMCYSIQESQEHFDLMRKLGKEGTVVKEFNGYWKDGTSKSQVKMKDTKYSDLRVISKLNGTGKNVSTFGSLYCISEDGKLGVTVSGFTDEQRGCIFDEWEDWKNCIVTVAFNEVITSVKSETYSMFLPRFIERRYDLTEADMIERILMM